MNELRAAACALAAFALATAGAPLCARAPPAAPPLSRCLDLGTSDRPIAYDPFMVFFDLGSAKITRPAAAILENVAIAYKDLSHCHLELGAHVDSLEANTRARGLDVRRAGAVAAFLRGKGIHMVPIVGAFGDTRPLVETAVGAPEPNNRRVEINVRP